MIRNFRILSAGLLLVLSATSWAALPAMVNDEELPSTGGHFGDEAFRRFFGLPDVPGGEREVASAGSGVIVDAENGYILTNHHVVEKADQIQISTIDGEVFDAEIVGSDPATDIAVIKVDASGLTDMPIGDSERVRVGDFVLAIGNPFGLGHTVTSGIVSALGRSGISRDGYEDFIQTDASINPGNSGGALVNLRGELVGINSAIISRTGGNVGIGFAVPTEIASSIMRQILDFGEVRRGLLGVSIADVNAEVAEALSSSVTSGALITRVEPGSAAEDAGLQVDDIIVGRCRPAGRRHHRRRQRKEDWRRGRAQEHDRPDAIGRRGRHRVRARQRQAQDLDGTRSTARDGQCRRRNPPRACRRAICRSLDNA
jgi:S1-C subfamily serine protease